MKILENKIRSTILLGCGIVFFTCRTGSEREFVIQNLCEKQIKFPETLDVSYKGFKVASAELLNSNGDYKVVDIDENVSFCSKTNYTLKPKDLLGVNYEFAVDTIIKGNYESHIKTAHYKCEENSEEKQKLIKMLNELREIIDTLAPANARVLSRGKEN